MTNPDSGSGERLERYKKQFDHQLMEAQKRMAESINLSIGSSSAYNIPSFGGSYGWFSSNGDGFRNTLSQENTMNKDQFAVLAEGASSFNKTFDTLDSAKQYAKQLTQTVKGRVLVLKAVYAVTPKVDVEEEDIA